ncbi:MAG: transglycosylase SLT domain-containing protein [Bacteroidia bacterium]|nr:transglycosylase SLT domain-containing protein [Bacteroidia bacterium]
MKKTSFCFIIPLFCFLFWIGSGSEAFSQAPIAPELIQDDPIVAALDKLYKLDLFEKGYAKINYPKNPKYHFAIDSIPHYDDLIYEARLAKLDALSPFDLEYNPYVQGYINMYTMRRREQVSRMMALSQYYFPMFEEMLDKYNLPLELKYLAICESALNPMAKSRSAAMGLWQFMYPTGKMFGLQVTSYVDERCDPYKSTQAACEYFQYLYGLFGDWQMVLAAYNGGPGTVNKAIRRSGGKKTYWEIRPYLPTETQGYVPAFIAVNYIMNYTSEHNIQTAIPKKIFLEVDTVVVKHQLSFDQISSMLNITDDELQYLNPSYRKRVIPVISGEPSFLTLPSDKIATFINNEANIYNFQKPDVLSIDVIASQEIKRIHVVKKGEGLAVIAKKYGCTVSDIKSWNGITSNTISAGKKLTIYAHDKKPGEKKVIVPANNSAPVVTTAKNTETSTDGFKLYTVKKGDSLYKIAERNNTTVDEIKRLNNFGVNYNLLPGKVIKINAL